MEAEQITKTDRNTCHALCRQAKPAPRHGGLVPPFYVPKRLRQNMNRLLLLTIVSIFCLSGCEEESIEFYLDSIDKNNYYSEEIIPIEHQNFYGKWRLWGISGGYSGSGYEPDFDFLETKPIGIYGLIRGDSIFEYGRIELDTFNANNSHLLQIKIHPENNGHYFFPPESQFTISIHGDSLDMYQPYPDSYSFHFKRIK